MSTEEKAKVEESNESNTQEPSTQANADNQASETKPEDNQQSTNSTKEDKESSNSHFENEKKALQGIVSAKDKALKEEREKQVLLEERCDCLLFFFLSIK